MRISVVGNSGSGKSTVARYLAIRLGGHYLELDAIYHQPGWQPLDDDEFVRQVGHFVAMDNWVVDGNYSTVRPLVWARAQVVVWLDQPRPLVLRRLVWRTLRRALFRAELWNGNRESLRNLLGGGEENVLLWSWRHHRIYRDRYAAAMTDDALTHLHFIRIRTRGAARPAQILAQIFEHDPNIGRTTG